MYGVVDKILVKKGDIVYNGCPLFVIKKGRNKTPISSRYNGVVKEIHVKEGERFYKNHLLLEIDLNKGNNQNQKESKK